MTESRQSVQQMHGLIGKIRTNPSYDYQPDATQHLRLALRAVNARNYGEVERQVKLLHVIRSVDVHGTIRADYEMILDVLRGRVASSRYRYGLAVVFHRRAAETLRRLRAQDVRVSRAWVRRNERWILRSRVLRTGQRTAMWLLAIPVEDMVEALVKQ